MGISLTLKRPWARAERVLIGSYCSAHAADCIPASSRAVHRPMPASIDLEDPWKRLNPRVRPGQALLKQPRALRPQIADRSPPARSPRRAQRCDARSWTLVGRPECLCGPAAGSARSMQRAGRPGTSAYTSLISTLYIKQHHRRRGRQTAARRQARLPRGMPRLRPATSARLPRSCRPPVKALLSCCAQLMAAAAPPSTALRGGGGRQPSTC
jgi:hypothetical protein